MSFTEHQEYHPIVDELVFYVTQWHETAAEKAAGGKAAAAEQAVPLQRHHCPR